MTRTLAVLVLAAGPVLAPWCPSPWADPSGHSFTALAQEKATAAGHKPAGAIAKPPPVQRPDPAVLEKAVQRGVDFLLKSQNKRGSWGSPELRGGVMIYAPVPGAHQAFEAAVTALAVAALIDTGGDRTEIRQAVERGETWLLEHLPKVRRANADAIYNVWTHMYGIQALVRMHRRLPDPQRRKEIEKRIAEQIGFLIKYESVDDGWGYYDFRVGAQRPASDSCSFVTAAALVAFREAKDIGVDVPEKLVKGAVASLHRQRLPDGSYLYGEYLKWQPAHPINRPGGSLGRSQACNVALRLWKDDRITDEVIKTWLNRLMNRNGWLDLGRKKPIPHESFFAVAGYFFYFGHYYAGLCIQQLPSGERPFYQDHLATVILRLQAEDGSWWDYPLYNYHQPYGTAFALMTLNACRRRVEQPGR